MDAPVAGVDVRFVGLPSPTAPRAGAGGHPCQGLYWTPSRRAPKTALIATHYNVDFAEHYLAPFAARVGLGFLGWNTRYRGAEDLFTFEHALIDIGVGVRWLKESAGVETVVILGNSGGGSLMGAYQAQARAPFLGGGEGGRAAEALAKLTPADLYISLNAHLGRPQVLTAWMDPAVVDERDPTLTDAALDAFNPANGPPYEAAYIARYRAAQRSRNRRITDWARAELARVQAAEVPDLLFPLHRTWADLRFMDGAIDPSQRPSPGCYAGDPRAANRRWGIGRASSLRTWLAMWSLEASPCQGVLGRVDVPALVIQSTADMGVFPSDARAIHAALGSADKSLEFLPGAHYFEDDEGGRGAVAELMRVWIAGRA